MKKTSSKPASRKPEGKKNEHFHLLFENNPLPMWVYDLETLSFLDVNEAAVELYGYSRNEFLKMRVTDIIPPDDVQRIRKTAQTKRSRLQHSGEWRHCKKDGSIIFVETKSHKINYGEHKAILEVALDITTHKQFENTIAASEAKYRTLIEQLPTVVYINPVDDPSFTIFISPQIKTMLGYTQAEWLADPKLWKKSLHPDDRQRVLAEAERMMASGESTDIEYRIMARDGRVVWVRDQAALVYDEKTGKPKFWQGVMINMTEQRQATQALSASEKRFRALTENSNDLVIIFDAAGTVTYVSPTVKHILGYTQEDMLGKSFAIWLHPDEVQQAMVSLSKRKQFIGVDFEPVTFRVRHHDGSWHFIEVVGNNLLDNPAVGGIVLNCRDVTERRQIEELLQQSEERFRNLFENSAIGIYRTTPDGRILLSNPALVQMLGYDSFEELARRNLETDGSNASYQRMLFREKMERMVKYAAWRQSGGEKTAQPFLCARAPA